MRDFVQAQTARLLRKLAQETDRTVQSQDEDAVHDLRVSIRRLSRCLRAFSPFYPGRSWKKVRRNLRVVMTAAGEVRDRDIYAALLSKARLDAQSPAFQRLAEERAEAARELSTLLETWGRRNTVKKWRAQLEL